MVRSKLPTLRPAADDRLEEARRRLEEFEGNATATELVARLRAANPVHPFLVLRALASMVCAICGTATFVSLLVPWIDRGLAQRIAALESVSGLPVPAALGILTACGAVALVAAHLGAASAGRNAAWRPREAKLHQRLMSDVRQLEAELLVRERITPRGASPRVHPRA